MTPPESLSAGTCKATAPLGPTAGPWNNPGTHQRAHSLGGGEGGKGREGGEGETGLHLQAADSRLWKLPQLLDRLCK